MNKNNIELAVQRESEKATSKDFIGAYINDGKKENQTKIFVKPNSDASIYVKGKSIKEIFPKWFKD